jgi:DNA-directed RNA polymerase II subunit RPB2
MDVARHVFETYFSDVKNVLVRHHLDSYGDLLSTKIPNFIKGSNPISLDLGDDRTIEVFIGGKDGKEITYVPPKDFEGNAVLPHNCRLENRTYSLGIKATFEIVYTVGSEKITKRFENASLAEIPLMLKSSMCYLSNMSSDELYNAGECKFELGGYFIVSGQERVLLTQERLGDNMFYASKRVKPPSTTEVRTTVEKEEEIKVEGATKKDEYEYIANIRSISEDGTRGPFSHFITIPSENIRPNDPVLIAKTPDYGVFYTKRLAMITLPGFVQPIPLLSVFYALGITNDQDIYDIILAGVPEAERTQYDEIFMELVFSHERFLESRMAKEDDKTEDPNMLILYTFVKSRTKAGVYMNLYNDMFPHCQLKEGESSASFYRRKAYLLGILTRMAMEVAIGKTPKTDREHYRFKRLDASGELCFQEFRRIFKENAKAMKLLMNSRVYYQKDFYEGKNVADLISDENVEFMWKPYMFLSELEKSFKGKWGGKDGVSQVLSRYSYMGASAHLRRVNLQMDKDTKQVEIRRIHGSSWGLMCPVDNPDGGNVGMIKSLSLLSSISTASSSSLLLDMVSKFDSFTPLHLIHPSTWDPRWTRVFLNSDLIGVVEGDTEALHRQLLGARRAGTLNKFISLCWNRMENDYNIYTDAGRPVRPLYREGVTPKQVVQTKKWDDMTGKLMDYIDAQETESLRISMEPFSPKYHSEIHGSAILSASASIIPYADHNAAVRNMFSCQQIKQACSWFNTAFNKRFDTMATWMNYAQRPMCQTWTVNSILGKDGCLPYGKNPLVAVATYTGYNQEDSVILNDASLKRGLFTITYYHGYDFQEEPILSGYDVEQKAIAVQMKTEFANVVTDPRFKDTVARRPNLDYSLLNSDGIIRKGVEVTDETVLVGMVTPIMDGGQIRGYKDVPFLPKKGQLGFVDDVYVYENSQGLRCVKIRIAEHREPIIGDKFSVRHGPKGTCGTRMAEEDMPYTASGLRPDMILNPHAFPSRMALGQVIEMMATRLGTQLGCLVDATPFSTQNRLGETRDLLVRAGFHSYGHETMYNGMTGEMIQTEIFMGPAYYVRLKQMVEDKINYRDTGPRKPLTHQPVEGRANDGGLRIGEMERDCLLSHGISKFLNESMMERSDKETLLFQPELGRFDAVEDYETTNVNVPYSMKLFLQEMDSMHVSTYLSSA